MALNNTANYLFEKDQDRAALADLDASKRIIERLGLSDRGDMDVYARTLLLIGLVDRDMKNEKAACEQFTKAPDSILNSVFCSQLADGRGRRSSAGGLLPPAQTVPGNPIAFKRARIKNGHLFDVDLQQGVGMLVAPVPISLLIGFIERRELRTSAMILFVVDTVSFVFVAIPLMIVVVLLIVIGANCDVILGSQRGGRQCQGSQHEHAEQSSIQET
jgi:hypothetical protein